MGVDAAGSVGSAGDTQETYQADESSGVDAPAAEDGAGASEGASAGVDAQAGDDGAGAAEAQETPTDPSSAMAASALEASLQDPKSYTAGPSYSQVDKGTSAFQKGQSGEGVAQVQRELNEAGYETNADGKFGTDTQASVKKFQQDQGLKQTGTVDPETLKALQEKNAGAGDGSDPAAAPPPAESPPPAGGNEPSRPSSVDDLEAKMRLGAASSDDVQKELDKVDGVIPMRDDDSLDMKNQIINHNCKHLANKMEKGETLSPAERQMAEKYLAANYSDNAVNTDYGYQYERMHAAGKKAGMVK